MNPSMQGIAIPHGTSDQAKETGGGNHHMNGAEEQGNGEKKIQEHERKPQLAALGGSGETHQNGITNCQQIEHLDPPFHEI